MRRSKRIRKFLRQKRYQVEQLESRVLLHAGAIISGYVYVDADDSNTKESAEIGIPGILISLKGIDENDQTVERSTLTDDNGLYTFEELLPGNYDVSKRQSSAVRNGSEASPADGVTVNDNQFDSLDVEDDVTLEENNFAELGLQTRFINILWQFASTPDTATMLRRTMALAEELDGDRELAETIRSGGSDVPESLNTAPTANEDSYQINEGEVLTLTAASGVLSNDVDAENDPLSASVVSRPANGTLEFNNDGSLTYTPDQDFSGTDTFTYVASDGALQSDAATVELVVQSLDPGDRIFGTVTPGDYQDEGLLGVRTDLLPGAPPMNMDHVTTAVDYSEYSNPPTYGPHHGFLLDEQGNAITPRATGVYETEQPDEDMVHGLEHGHVWISYNPLLITSDDLVALRRFVVDGGTNTGVIMTPRAANDHAIAVASWARLLTLDTFDDAQIRDFVESNRGKSAGEGYIPSGQKSDDPSSENLSDGLPHTPPVMIENTAPTAVDDAFDVSQGTTLSVSAVDGVLGNDFDAENDPLTASVADDVSSGVLTLNSDGSFEYSPNAQFVGSDAFTYRASDGELSSTVATVTINVTSDNAAPVAAADSYFVDENETLAISAANGVLANDIDPDNDSLTATLNQDVTNGELVFETSGSFRYTPAPGFTGIDSFRYRVSDGVLASDSTEVTLRVDPVQNPPFGRVTPGSFREQGLAGVRTDLETGAPPMNADHVTTAVDYSAYSNPPTYGPHHGFLLDAQGNAITPRATGIYETEQPDEDMVHGLEHGHVWISYNPNLISAHDLAKLQSFVVDGGTNTGVIMTPRAANNDAIAVASWGRLLTLDTFDDSQIRNFVERNRGKSDGEGFIPSGQKSDGPNSETLSDGLPHTLDN